MTASASAPVTAFPKAALAKAAFITGAADRIGAHIARHLAGRGFTVVIHYHQNKDKARSVCEEIRCQGGDAFVLNADLIDPCSVQTLILRAEDAARMPLNLLVNNAAVFDPQPWGEMTYQDWRLHMDINAAAPVFLAQDFYKRHMRHMEAGRDLSDPQIINIIDQRVVNITSFAPAYTASKCTLWAMTQSMAMAFAPHVRVNAIGPGLTLPLPDETPEEFERRWQQKPLACGGKAEDICAAVEYLTGATSVTGQLLLVDGGEHLIRPVSA